MSSSSFRGATLEHTGTFVSTWPVLTEVCQLVPGAMAPRVSGISSSHLTTGHGNIWIINCAHWGE